jgi:opacity protein-like surface antigen
VGGHLGGLWTGDDEVSAEKKKCFWKWCSDWKDAKHVKFSDDDDDDVSLIGGVHVGYNWQKDSSVFGIEADVGFADGLDYLATLRARLGYARGDLLVYATGGVAFAGFDDDAVSFKTHNKTYSLGGDDDDRKIGLVVGGGAEYKIRPNWSVGVEGLYYAFGDDKNTYNVKEYGWWGMKKYKVTEEQDNDLWTVRARLTYHFGDDEADAPLK